MDDLEPIRLVGIRLDNLSSNLYSMFDKLEEDINKEKLDKALDQIKEKYGKDLKVKIDKFKNY